MPAAPLSGLPPHTHCFGALHAVAVEMAHSPLNRARAPAPPPAASQHWLGHVGSPASTIERLDVANERSIGALEYTDMQRRPNVP